MSHENLSQGDVNPTLRQLKYKARVPTIQPQHTALCCFSIVPQLDHNRFLPNTYQLIIRQSSYHSILYGLELLTVSLNKLQTQIDKANKATC